MQMLTLSSKLLLVLVSACVVAAAMATAASTTASAASPAPIPSTLVGAYMGTVQWGNIAIDRNLRLYASASYRRVVYVYDATNSNNRSGAPIQTLFLNATTSAVGAGSVVINSRGDICASYGSLSESIVSCFTSTGAFLFSFPVLWASQPSTTVNLAVDSDDNLYATAVLSSQPNVIVKYDRNGTYLNVFQNDSIGLLGYVAVDSQHNVYAAYNAVGPTLTPTLYKFFANGQPDDTFNALQIPIGSSNSLGAYKIDAADRLYRVSSAAAPAIQVLSLANGSVIASVPLPSVANTSFSVADFCIDHVGNLYLVTSYYYYSPYVWKIAPNGTVLSDDVTHMRPKISLPGASSFVIDRRNRALFVATNVSPPLRYLPTTAGLNDSLSAVVPLPTTMSSTRSIAQDLAGRLYVLDSVNGSVCVIDPDALPSPRTWFIRNAAISQALHQAMTVDLAGAAIYYSRLAYVYKISTSDSSASLLLSLTPSLLAMACGPDGLLYGVSPTALVRISVAGGVVVGSAELSAANGASVAVDQNGFAYVASYDCVYLVSPSNDVSVFVSSVPAPLPNPSLYLSAVAVTADSACVVCLDGAHGLLVFGDVGRCNATAQPAVPPYVESSSAVAASSSLAVVESSSMAMAMPSSSVAAVLSSSALSPSMAAAPSSSMLTPSSSSTGDAGPAAGLDTFWTGSTVAIFVTVGVLVAVLVLAGGVWFYWRCHVRRRLSGTGSAATSYKYGYVSESGPGSRPDVLLLERDV